MSWIDDNLDELIAEDAIQFQQAKQWYETLSDAKLREQVKEVLLHKYYKENEFTKITKAIINYQGKLSEKQKNVLYRHLFENDSLFIF